MLETPHVIIAAAIAYKIPEPMMALPLAFTSHFVFDSFPHWNPSINTEKNTKGSLSNRTKLIITIDVLLSLVFGFLIASTVLPNINHFIVIISGCFLAVLPDLIEAPYFLLDHKNKFLEAWLRFKKSIQIEIDALWGNISQVAVSISALLWIFS